MIIFVTFIILQITIIINVWLQTFRETMFSDFCSSDLSHYTKESAYSLRVGIVSNVFPLKLWISWINMQQTEPQTNFLKNG